MDGAVSRSGTYIYGDRYMVAHGVGNLEYPQSALPAMSEEHGHLDVSRSNARPRLGERMTIIPNHACAVSSLHDRVYGVRGDRVERVIAVAARGHVQ